MGAHASALKKSHSNILLPKELKNHIIKINGSYPLLQIEKSLDENDINHKSDRLLLPFDQINGVFLTLEEELRLFGSSKESEVQVGLLEPSLSECALRLKRGSSSGSYELTKGWSSVVRRNGLKVGSKVQLWAFRVESELCFALVIE